MGKGTGGMQTSGLKYAIMCPRCNKPAFRMEKTGFEEIFFHFTKKGFTKHVIKREDHND